MSGLFERLAQKSSPAKGQDAAGMLQSVVTPVPLNGADIEAEDQLQTPDVGPEQTHATDRLEPQVAAQTETRAAPQPTAKTASKPSLSPLDEPKGTTATPSAPSASAGSINPAPLITPVQTAQPDLRPTRISPEEGGRTRDKPKQGQSPITPQPKSAPARTAEKLIPVQQPASLERSDRNAAPEPSKPARSPLVSAQPATQPAAQAQRSTAPQTQARRPSPPPVKISIGQITVKAPAAKPAVAPMTSAAPAAPRAPTGQALKNYLGWRR